MSSSHYRGVSGIRFSDKSAAARYRKQAETNHNNKVEQLKQWKKDNPNYTVDELLAAATRIA